MRGVLAYRAAHFHKPLLESQAPCPQTLPGKGLKAFHAGTPRASLTSLATFVISSLLSQQKSSLSYLLFFKMYPFIISRLLPSPASLGHLSPALPSPPCCSVLRSQGLAVQGRHARWGGPCQHVSAVKQLQRDLRTATQAPQTGMVRLALCGWHKLQNSLSHLWFIQKMGHRSKAGEASVRVRQEISEGKAREERTRCWVYTHVTDARVSRKAFWEDARAAGHPGGSREDEEGPGEDADSTPFCNVIIYYHLDFLPFWEVPEGQQVHPVDLNLKQRAASVSRSCCHPDQSAGARASLRVVLSHPKPELSLFSTGDVSGTKQTSPAFCPGSVSNCWPGRPPSSGPSLPAAHPGVLPTLLASQYDWEGESRDQPVPELARGCKQVTPVSGPHLCQPVVV